MRNGDILLNECIDFRRKDMEYNKNLLRNSQKLRREMTKEERHLWYDFLKTYPVQFRRQYMIGNYITDFYCHKARLVLELDGSQHYDTKEMAHDIERTDYLEKNGLMVLRFSNLDVLRQFSGVCQKIDMTVKERIAAEGSCVADR